MITQASDKRAAVIALTILLASREIPTADEHVWRKDEWQWSAHRKTAAPYLAFLRDELGYTLSPIEAAVAAGEQFDPLAADADAAGDSRPPGPGPAPRRARTPIRTARPPARPPPVSAPAWSSPGRARSRVRTAARTSRKFSVYTLDILACTR